MLEMVSRVIAVRPADELTRIVVARLDLGPLIPDDLDDPAGAITAVAPCSPIEGVLPNKASRRVVGEPVDLAATVANLDQVSFQVICIANDRAVGPLDLAEPVKPAPGELPEQPVVVDDLRHVPAGVVRPPGGSTAGRRDRREASALIIAIFGDLAGNIGEPPRPAKPVVLDALLGPIRFDDAHAVAVRINLDARAASVGQERGDQEATRVVLVGDHLAQIVLDGREEAAGVKVASNH
ncbi:hypothetical protein WME94_32150 [Sorangium sp. So ce429]